MIEIPEKNWFRPVEAARLFGVSVRTVYRWHESGWLVGVRFSPRTLKFRRGEIVRFLGRYKDRV